MRKTTLKISKILPVVILFMLTAFSALAQNVITGKVTESRNGTAVSNVTVTVKGTRVSTQTGNDGSFRISSPSANPTLVFSSIGYSSQEVTASGNAVNISMVQSDQKLDEIVVVAYGTRKKSDLTGAVTQVSAKDFQKGNIASSEQLLQGKVAGLEVTTGGGSAGGGSKIRIRQGASLNASNDPLIVIDGVPVESNDVAGSGNYLNTINPNDIESISVLKDASATALYGSRASNGVLIVTTKKGGRGKARFNFNTQMTMSTVSNYIDVLSADQLRDVVNADAAATGNNTYKNLLGNANTDWQKQIFQKALSTQNNLSAAGSFGSKSINIPYRISLGHLYQEGTLKTDKFDRLTTAINLSPKFFNDHLAVNVNFKYTKTQKRFADEGAVGSAASFDPTQYVRNNNPKTAGYYEWTQADGNPIDLATRNPLALLNLRSNTSRVNRIVGNVQLDYKLPFFPDLHVQANLGLDNSSTSGNDNIDSTSATNFRTKGRYSHYEQKKKNYLADVSLFYTKDIERINSKIDVLVAHSYQDFFTEVENFASYGQDGRVIPTSIPTFATDKPQYRLESYIGRINLTLFNKYLLTGSIRRDASSKFSEDNRVGYFPAAAIAWKLKEELFKNSNVVSDLKLRFGWGVTGQQDGIGFYSYLPVYAQSSPTAQYLFGNTYYSFLRPSAYDANIKWETTTTTNLGLDFGFLKNRISGTIELYKKKTEDLLSVIPVAPGSNFDISLL
ncbi:MAG: SusC/RagA family TonB-linked outer membrane protein, partial [Ferruginibacter sp.]|nr:SusC/RagA family TonB-linked outer membrane protein [Ferruginibacter sp.]